MMHRDDCHKPIKQPVQSIDLLVYRITVVLTPFTGYYVHVYVYVMQHPCCMCAAFQILPLWIL